MIITASQYYSLELYANRKVQTPLHHQDKENYAPKEQGVGMDMVRLA
jgi:hypothetical protein